jgi:hypothetical protein
MISAAVLHRRLRAHRLVASREQTARDVVHHLGAVQAQDFAGASWAVAQRLAPSAADDVLAALASGAIVRTHVMRPTWHLVAASDLRWLQQLTAPRVRQLCSYQDRKCGLDDNVFAKTRAVFERELAGVELTRAEVSAALARAKIPATGQRLGQILMRAELDLVICSGGLRGKQHTYALVADRAPAAALDREAGLAELARRFFAGHGPATIADFAWWSGLTVADCRLAVALAGDGVAIERFDRTSYLVAAAAAGSVTAKARAPIAHVLANFDEYLIAYVDRVDLIDERVRARPAGRGGVIFSNALLIDGKVVGTWKRAKAGISPALWIKPSRAERAALGVAIARFDQLSNNGTARTMSLRNHPREA